MGWKSTTRSLLVALPLIATTVLTSGEARAVGEMKSGFPNWAERVLLEWSNRARVDPSIEMTACGTPCAEKACYTAQPPLYWSEWHSHAARFHSVEQIKQGYFAHDSKCQVAANIKDIYPGTCDGSAACACTAAAPITTWAARIGLFGVSAGGEIIASPSDPNSAFYLWLFENSTTTTCGFTSANGHRYNILTAGPAVGYGVDGYSTGDFGGGGDVAKIPSGSHYPEGGASVDLWTNWFDTAAPKLAQVNLGGACQTMTLARGTATNGAYTYKASGLGACTRYYFAFKDSAGTDVTYPTTGSLGIGGGACASWDATRPAAGTGCSCTPSCSGKTCGDNGCGGSCGTCAAPATCGAAGSCVTVSTDAGVDTGGDGGAGVDSGSGADGAPTDGGPTDGGPTDGGPKSDTGGVDGGAKSDTGGPGDLDPALPDPDGGNADAPDAPFEGSCSCRVGPGAAGQSRSRLVLGALALLGLAVAHRRRRRDAR